MSDRGCFEPGLASPRKPPNKGNKGRHSDRPYAAACVSALRLGLAVSDLHQMPLTTVLDLVREYVDMSSPEERDDVRRGTKADLDALFS